VRHVSRCRSALKHSAARRGALADDAPGPLRDLKMLKQFKQSLPTDVRLAVIAPLTGLGILFFAFILAKFVMKAVYTKLLADLTTAAVTLDRGAALAAFEKDRGGPPHREAKCGRHPIGPDSDQMPRRRRMGPGFATSRQV
jgi:hypothetical protein